MTALRAVYEVLLTRVRQMAAGGDGYTALQFAAAALFLLKSPYRAVTQHVVEEELAKYAEPVSPGGQQQLGRDALLCLVRANALALRPHSLLARDVSAAAFAVKGAAVVTAPTAMHFYCMQQLEEELQGKLNDWEQLQEVGVTFLRQY
jgi:hypothetical protein